LGFSLTVAVIAAAVADPIVEFASNSGWFGPGSYTDRCSLDVVPAMLAGVGLLVLYLARKAPTILSGRDVSNGIATLPASFGLQIVTLYLMETTEQLVVRGHALGPTIWLGGPAAISLAIHAALCAAVTFALLRSNRRLAATTIKVIRLITAMLRFAAQTATPAAVRRFENRALLSLSPLRFTIGERAPPQAA
jgi:hypothetical protein